MRRSKFRPAFSMKLGDTTGATALKRKWYVDPLFQPVLPRLYFVGPRSVTVR